MEASPPPPPPPPAGRKAAAAAAAQEKRRLQLQEFLAAKGKLNRPGTARAYLKDKTNGQNPAPSKPQPAVKRQHKAIPGTTKGAQTKEAKRPEPAGHRLAGRLSVPPASRKPRMVPSQPPGTGPVLPPSTPSVKSQREKPGSVISSARRPLCRTGKLEKQEPAMEPRTVESLAAWSRPPDNLGGEAAACNEGNLAGKKRVPERKQRATSVHGLKAESKAPKKPMETSRRALGSTAARRGPFQSRAGASRTAEARAEGQSRGAAAALQALRPQRQRPSSQPPAISGTVVKRQGQNPRPRKPPQEAAGRLGRGRPLTGGEAAAQFRSRRASAVLPAGRSSCRAPQEGEQPTRPLALKRSSAVEQRVTSKPTPERLHAARGSLDLHGAELKQTPRTSRPRSRRTASATRPAKAAAGSFRCGGGTPRSRQPAVGAGQALQTPHPRDRRKLLEQWLASRGKSYKRPPMILPPKTPRKAEESLNLSFWNGMEEERQQLSMAGKITSMLAECQRLAEEGHSSEELLSMLSRIPEAEKFAQFWVCKAKVLARQGTLDVAGLCEAAVRAGAVPVQELRDAVVDILKTASKTAQATLAEGSPLPGEPLAERSLQRPLQCSTDRPVSAVKLQVVPLLSFKGPSRRSVVKILTPVRRSLRIEQAAARYSRMLKDHDPVVSSLDELLATDHESQFVWRANEALPEGAEMAFLHV